MFLLFDFLFLERREKYPSLYPTFFLASLPKRSQKIDKIEERIGTSI
jgi:hypothetical protein